MPTEAFPFSVLNACAVLMAAGYALDAAGFPISWPVLAVAAAAAFVGSMVLLARGPGSRTDTVTLFASGAVFAAASGYLLWLASPSFLPVTDGPDVVHHLQLIHSIQRTHRLPHDPALIPYLLEMMNYTPGSHILAAALMDGLRVDAVRLLQPITAVLTGVKVGMAYLTAVRACGGMRAARTVAMTAALLAFVPAVYTVGSTFRFFFYAQVVAEAFAIGMLLAVMCWRDSGSRVYLVVFAAMAVGTFLSWPVWLGPGVAVLLLALMVAPIRWGPAVAAAAVALTPVTLVAVLHAMAHPEGGRIFASSGAVTRPSIEALGMPFVALAAVGAAVVTVRIRGGLPVIVFAAAALIQSVAFALLALRAGVSSFYLPFKMMYLVVLPCAVLGAIALAWLVERLGEARPRARGPAAVAVVVAVLALVATRVPRQRPSSPITGPSYAAGLWARDHLDPACIDYFSAHWLTGYWLHLDVLGNPRDSARMRAETFEFHDSVARWLQGHGQPYGFVEDFARVPRELRPEMTPIYKVASTAIVRNARSPGCR